MTITLDEDVARWARIRAAERETGVSRLIGEWLREKMLAEQSHEVARGEYLARPAQAQKDGGPLSTSGRPLWTVTSSPTPTSWSTAAT